MASTLRGSRIVPVCVWYVWYVWCSFVRLGEVWQRPTKPGRPELVHVEAAKALLRSIVRLVIPGA